MENKKWIRLVILYSGLSGLLRGIHRFVIPIALIEYNWDIGAFALVFGFQALSMALPFVFGGLIADLLGRRLVVSIGFLASSLGAAMMFFAISGSSILPIIIAQMIITMSSGLTQIGLSTLLVDLTVTGQSRTQNMGNSAGLKSLAAFIGPVIMGLLISEKSLFNLTLFGFSPIKSSFLIVIGISLPGIFSIFVLPPTSKHELTMNRDASLIDLSTNQRKMQGAFLIQEIVIGITSGAIVPFIDYYVLTRFEPDSSLWGLVFGLSNSTIALGSVLVGRYSEGMGKGITIIRLNAMAPFLALGIALAPSFSLVAIFYIFRAGVANSVHPAWESWYFTHTLETIRGRSMSVIQISRRLARSLGVALGPGLFAVVGSFAFPLSSIFYPIAMSIPYYQERRIN